MSASRVPYKVSDFAKSLDDDELKIYCKVLEDLKCSDPLVLNLNLFKCGSELETDGEKVEAINNFLSSEQYLTNAFSYKLLAFQLPNGIVILRSHITHSPTLSAKPAPPWVALQSDGKIVFAVCDCLAGLGNSCIHVSALLKQAINEHQKDKSTTTNATTTSVENRIPVTSLPCYWNKFHHFQ